MHDRTADARPRLAWEPRGESKSAPPSRVETPPGRQTWSTGTSPQPAPTSCGSPTSPTSRPGPAWSTCALIIDVYSRMIVGWRAATTMKTSLVLDALEMALWQRRRDGINDLTGLVHHTDAGSQYTSFAFTQRLIDAGVGPRRWVRWATPTTTRWPSPRSGSTRAELIWPDGPWKDVDHVETGDPRAGSTGSTPQRSHEAIDDLHTANRQNKPTTLHESRLGRRPAENQVRAVRGRFQPGYDLCNLALICRFHHLPHPRKTLVPRPRTPHRRSPTRRLDSHRPRRPPRSVPETRSLTTALSPARLPLPGLRRSRRSRCRRAAAVRRQLTRRGRQPQPQPGQQSGTRHLEQDRRWTPQSSSSYEAPD